MPLEISSVLIKLREIQVSEKMSNRKLDNRLGVKNYQIFKIKYI